MTGALSKQLVLLDFKCSTILYCMPTKLSYIDHTFKSNISKALFMGQHVHKLIQTSSNYDMHKRFTKVVQEGTIAYVKLMQYLNVKVRFLW